MGIEQARRGWWDLYPQNLMSEYHIRYGGYGGIGYYLVVDSYIAPT
jgi:Tn3 transposase DDE domain